MAKTSKETPLMKQYNQIKAKYPDALLLFRVGDFYETFKEDAVKTSQVLGIVLTSRNNGSEDTSLAGFPHHALNNYLPKLGQGGLPCGYLRPTGRPQTHQDYRQAWCYGTSNPRGCP